VSEVNPNDNDNFWRRTVDIDHASLSLAAHWHIVLVPDRLK
jgi:hypothetical protein